MNFFIELLFPRRCPVCDQAVKPFGQKICRECIDKLKVIEEDYCLKCGKPLLHKEEEFCFDCKKKRHFFEKGRAVFEYKSISMSIYRFKYMGRQEYAEYYGEVAGKLLKEELGRMNPDAIIPVPLHSEKRKKRGYNQAHLFAKALSKTVKIPVRDDLVIRQKNTEALKLLNPMERQNNLKKAFKITQNDVKLDTVVIIDDIFTTGNTIDAIASVLLQAGVKRIFFIALAIGNGL